MAWRLHWSGTLPSHPISNNQFCGLAFALEWHPAIPFQTTHFNAGQRRFLEAVDPDSDSDSDVVEGGLNLCGLDNSLLLWRFQHTWMTIDGPPDGPSSAAA